MRPVFRQFQLKRVEPVCLQCIAVVNQYASVKLSQEVLAGTYTQTSPC